MKEKGKRWCRTKKTEKIKKCQQNSLYRPWVDPDSIIPIIEDNYETIREIRSFTVYSIT